MKKIIMEFQLYVEQEHLEKQLKKLTGSKNQKEIKIIQKELKVQFNIFIKKCVQLISHIQQLKESNIFLQQEQLLIANLDLVSMLIEKYKIYFTSQEKFVYELVILYTKTYFYSNSFFNKIIQNKDNIRKKFFDYSQKLEEKIEEHYNFDNENFHSSESTLMPYEQQQFGKKTFEAINMCLFLQEIHLVRAVLYSTINCNEEALEQALEGHQLSEKLFNVISQLLNIIILVGHENLKQFNFDSKKNFIGIKKYVDFIKKQNLPESNNNYQWEPESSDWKISKNNLSKFLEKKIRSNSNFEFLVDKFENDWIQKFSIAEISRLKQPTDLLDIINNPKFDQDFILRSIIIFSCNFYSIAAEHRTISKTILRNKYTEKKAFALLSSRLTAASKNFIKNELDKGQLIKNKGFNLSKEVHEKALEILLFGFNNNIYLSNYFIQKYKINYCTISTIPEVEEPSHSPTRYSKSNYQQFDEESVSQHQEQINFLKNQIQQKLGITQKQSNPQIKIDFKNDNNQKNKRSKTLTKKKKLKRENEMMNQYSFKHRNQKQKYFSNRFKSNKEKQIKSRIKMSDQKNDIFTASSENNKLNQNKTSVQIQRYKDKSQQRIRPLKTIKRKFTLKLN